ncbi:MAG: chemotaxis protein CheA [Terriglobales bacterium]
MSFFSPEGAGELRELFFASAQEILQTLDQEGLELEKRPGDAEVVRGIRRAVHTLKGDSAACGYRELSELAHQLEDALTPEAARSVDLADVVLTAVDTFEAMLAACRDNRPLPAADALRKEIARLSSAPLNPSVAELRPQFVWSEYERLVIADASSRGPVFNIALSIDADCPIAGAAVQLARNAFEEAGTVLAFRPESLEAGETPSIIEAAVASSRDAEWILRRCSIPAVVAHVRVEPCGAPTASESLNAALVEAAAISAVINVPEPAPATPERSASRPAAADNTLRVDAERIDGVLNLVGELVIGKSMLHESVSEFERRFPKDPLRVKLADALAFQARVLNDLQKSVMRVRMVPVEQLFRRFPRLVRDVARARGKQVELALSGQETELDKSILDALAEPLAHLVRNAVDHGLESSDARVDAGKNPQGTVSLHAYHQGNQIVIEVADDGRGIDRERLVAKAIEKGAIGAEEAERLTEAEGLNLIFQPGLSTADHLTEISGRGVGMDVVKSVVDRLKGTVSIATTPGQGTRFQLRVPLTVAIIQALLFRVTDRTYAVPLSSVVEITRARESEIHHVNEHEVMQLRDQVLTMIRVDKLASGKASRADKFFVIVVAIADRKFGLMVERLVREEELVIKALDDHLVATDLVSGASILGDGTVVLILDIASVIERHGRTPLLEQVTA